MTTIRSHYLPKTYLKHFLHNDVLFMYKKGEKFFKDVNTKSDDRILEVRGENGLLNIGVEKHLYNPEIEGLTSDDIESIFQELGENVYDTVISEIETLNNGSPVPLSVKDPICLMMASLRVRTPLFKKDIEDMDEQMQKHIMAKNYERMTIEEVMQLAKEVTKKEISKEVATKIKDSFVSKKYNMNYPNAYFIKHALLLVDEHINIFHQMTMTICKSKGRFFITNDTPLVYFVPQEFVNFYNPPKGLVTPHCEVFFPLSKNTAVHMTWRKEKEEIKEVSRDMVDAFNYNLSHNSLDFIFAPMKINELDIFTKEYIPYPFKFAIH
ncbi:MAG: DUF4238 domain-containing protein [Minisyncoccia bacterium]